MTKEEIKEFVKLAIPGIFPESYNFFYNDRSQLTIEFPNYSFGDIVTIRDELVREGFECGSIFVNAFTIKIRGE